jgi:hypothetical protein
MSTQILHALHAAVSKEGFGHADRCCFADLSPEPFEIALTGQTLPQTPQETQRFGLIWCCSFRSP